MRLTDVTIGGVRVVLITDDDIAFLNLLADFQRAEPTAVAFLGFDSDGGEVHAG